MSETEPEELNINRMNNSIGKNTEIETNNVLADAAAASSSAETPGPAADTTPAETPGPAAAAEPTGPAAAETPGPGPGPAEAEAKTETAEAKTETAEAKQLEGKSKHHDGSRGDEADAEQDKMNKEAAAAAAEKKKKIVDKIKKLELDIILKGKELDQKYIAAKGDDKTQEGLEVDMEAFSTETNEEIDKLYEQLNDTDEEPLIIKLFSGAWNLIESKFQVIFKKMMLKPKVAEAQLEMLDIISKNIKDIKDNGGSLDTEYAQNLENLILSLSKDVSQTPGKSESSKTPDTPGAGMMDKIKGAFNKLKTPAPGPGGPGEKAEEKKEEVEKEEVEKEPEEKEPEEKEAAEEPAEAEGEQGGGGISRKRGHPKYINQISENRNKIFKKELEIINSIRHFHRSHTIRKRDKINSILGLRKSKNNKRSSNTKNTRRHRHEHQHKHRHNNHKHKSAKHVKK